MIERCRTCGHDDRTVCNRPDCPYGCRYDGPSARSIPRFADEPKAPTIQGVRPDRDQLGLRLASVWSMRGTCARRRVGCVLMDRDGYQLSAGYNGPAAGEAHCTEYPCAGATQPSGQGLDLCEAIHAEANAILRCPDIRQIHVAYVTASPCIHCVKLLMNTACERIVFSERYAHDEAAKALWLRPRHYPLGGPGSIEAVAPVKRTWEQL